MVIDLNRALSYLLAFAAIAFLARLLRFRSVPFYPYLSIYVLVLSVELLCLLVVRRDRDIYAYIYFASQAVNLLIAFGVVREIYAMALKDRPALWAFGSKVLLGAVSIAAIVAGLSWLLDKDVLPGQPSILHRVFSIERTANMALLLLLLMISVYLAWFPVKLRRNILLYSGGFALFFFARSIGLLAVNLSSATLTPIISNAMLFAQIACVSLWIWGFRRENEDEQMVSGHRWNPAEMDRLTQQLDSINTALTRFNHR